MRGRGGGRQQRQEESEKKDKVPKIVTKRLFTTIAFSFLLCYNRLVEFLG